jgi:hypothetical protein
MAYKFEAKHNYKQRVVASARRTDIPFASKTFNNAVSKLSSPMSLSRSNEGGYLPLARARSSIFIVLLISVPFETTNKQTNKHNQSLLVRMRAACVSIVVDGCAVLLFRTK